MNTLEREALLRELERPNLMEDEKIEIQEKLYKMDKGKPDWLMWIFMGLCLVFLFLLAMTNLYIQK